MSASDHQPSNQRVNRQVVRLLIEAARKRIRREREQPQQEKAA